MEYEQTAAVLMIGHFNEAAKNAADQQGDKYAISWTVTAGEISTAQRLS